MEYLDQCATMSDVVSHINAEKGVLASNRAAKYAVEAALQSGYYESSNDVTVHFDVVVSMGAVFDYEEAKLIALDALKSELALD